MFIAEERGPEFVGQIGEELQFANNQQIERYLSGIARSK